MRPKKTRVLVLFPANGLDHEDGCSFVGCGRNDFQRLNWIWDAGQDGPLEWMFVRTRVGHDGPRPDCRDQQSNRIHVNWTSGQMRTDVGCDQIIYGINNLAAEPKRLVVRWALNSTCRLGWSNAIPRINSGIRCAEASAARPGPQSLDRFSRRDSDRNHIASGLRQRHIEKGSQSAQASISAPVHEESSGRC